MRYLKTYEKHFFDKIKNLIKPKEVSKINPDSVIQTIKDVLIELSDIGFKIDIKTEISAQYFNHNQGGEIQFGPERTCIHAIISKEDNFQISEIKDTILTAHDMVKSEFGLECRFYYSSIGIIKEPSMIGTNGRPLIGATFIHRNSQESIRPDKLDSTSEKASEFIIEVDVPL